MVLFVMLACCLSVCSNNLRRSARCVVLTVLSCACCAAGYVYCMFIAVGVCGGGGSLCHTIDSLCRIEGTPIRQNTCFAPSVHSIKRTKLGAYKSIAVHSTVRCLFISTAKQHPRVLVVCTWPRPFFVSLYYHTQYDSTTSCCWSAACAIIDRMQTDESNLSSLFDSWRCCVLLSCTSVRVVFVSSRVYCVNTEFHTRSYPVFAQFVEVSTPSYFIAIQLSFDLLVLLLYCMYYCTVDVRSLSPRQYPLIPIHTSVYLSR